VGCYRGAAFRVWGEGVGFPYWVGVGLRGEERAAVQLAGGVWVGREGAGW